MSLLLALVSGSPANYSITGAAGSYAVTGNSAVIAYGGAFVNYAIAGAAGSYALTGVAAVVQRSRALQASAGSYAVSGNAAAINYVPAVNYALSALPGSYLITGQPASVLFSGVSLPFMNGGGFPQKQYRYRYSEKVNKKLEELPREVAQVIEDKARDYSQEEISKTLDRIGREYHANYQVIYKQLLAEIQQQDEQRQQDEDDQIIRILAEML